MVSAPPNGGGQVMAKLSLEVPKVQMTVRAYLSSREALTIRLTGKGSVTSIAAIVAIQADVVYTRHKRIGADSEVVPARGPPAGALTTGRGTVPWALLNRVEEADLDFPFARGSLRPDVVVAGATLFAGPLLRFYRQRFY